MKQNDTINTTELNHLNILYVFALESEAGTFFKEDHKIFTGVGKVNAAYHLMKALQTNRPDIIINVGSAGSNNFKRGTVVCCNQFIQRDMDVQGLGFDLYQTPFSKVPAILQYGKILTGLPLGICGTGDNFDTSNSQRSYNVVDMEAYALALIAQEEEIPFLCLKYISDGGDETAAVDWQTSVVLAAEALKNAVTHF